MSLTHTHAATQNITIEAVNPDAMMYPLPTTEEHVHAMSPLGEEAAVAMRGALEAVAERHPVA